MDPAFLLLVVFMVYSVLLGVCLARMKAINRELDLMKGVITTLGNLQREGADFAASKPAKFTPELLDQLRAMLGANDG